MFAIRSKEVKAVENNLESTRKELKELKEAYRKLAIENEKLKTEKILDAKENEKLRKKIKRLEADLNVDFWRG